MFMCALAAQRQCSIAKNPWRSPQPRSDREPTSPRPPTSLKKPVVSPVYHSLVYGFCQHGGGGKKAKRLAMVREGVVAGVRMSASPLRTSNRISSIKVLTAQRKYPRGGQTGECQLLTAPPPHRLRHSWETHIFWQHLPRIFVFQKQSMTDTSSYLCCYPSWQIPFCIKRLR